MGHMAIASRVPVISPMTVVLKDQDMLVEVEKNIGNKCKETESYMWCRSERRDYRRCSSK